MPSPDPSNPVAFFTALRRGFSERLTRPRVREVVVDRLLEDCFAALDQSCGDVTGLACRRGCATCCAVRVVATAPEILLIARAIKSQRRKAAEDLGRRIAAAARATRQLDELDRMALAAPCPFVGDNICLIYAIRPLACRSHVSFDEAACLDALAGLPVEIPVSAIHLTARSLIQNAMQAALRDTGYAWGIYELNQGLRIALKDHGAERAWLDGHDVFRSALINDVSEQEMAQAFDAIKELGG
ncbi:protein of unknown function UPF0153 [Methylocella silvestris BL2]|uniref:Zinc/iron-chelating domain-containing protein n=1 Tax=Methylocella silvestris (strain DSM 15510 / CIP 108128 / LMG 27833 / NCIMB 13906 / BL2) TaxID=395965 RepID=B8EN76_METSB|nr:zinc/iron-chelating domain-containing protein [Methylocella silvestris]ACK49589.1 protein of unknown function UPF0153 [Methylocella silvestris BL2]